LFSTVSGQLSLTSQSISCKGDSNGTISATWAYSGIDSIQILNNLGDTIEKADVTSLTNYNFTGLKEGAYEVQIIDVGTVLYSDNVNVTSPAILQLGGLITNSICNGYSIIKVSSIGGNSGFQYDFGNSGTFNSTTTYSNLWNGSYTVVV